MRILVPSLVLLRLLGRLEPDKGNCDTPQVFYGDADGDGFGDAMLPSQRVRRRRERSRTTRIVMTATRRSTLIRSRPVMVWTRIVTETSMRTLQTRSRSSRTPTEMVSGMPAPA